MWTDFLTDFSVNASYGAVVYVVLMMSVFVGLVVINEACLRLTGHAAVENEPKSD